MKIWILSISHRHGEDITPYVTKKAADDALDAYVKEWWLNEVGNEPLPADREDMRQQYFNAAEDELADITEHDLNLGLTIENLQTLVDLAEACTEGSREHKEHVEAIANAKTLIAEVENG